MNATWGFPVSSTIHRTGLGEAGIETFSGSPIGSLVREICQNSLDAVKDVTKPVEVEFNSFNINKNEFPDYNTLIEIFNQCKTFSDTHMDNKKTSKFFQKAIEIIDKNKIPMLRISDYNTRGLTGSGNIDKTNAWTSLIYSDGISDKDSNSAGSYGIGKNATFACSDFRTVFYSTYDFEGNKVSQGVSKLISFKNTEGKFVENIGYYGESLKPVYNLINIDSTYTRDTSGTDIYIAAFKQPTDWEKGIIVSVLENFILSIFSDKLSVKVNDKIINKNTLKDLINMYSDSLKFSYDYYQVLVSDKTVSKDIEISDIGTVNIKVLFDKNFKRRVLMSRGNGMKIYDQDRISASVYFAGVLSITDDRVNEVFRAMENPQHSAWEPDRCGDKKRVYKKILQQLKRDIKTFIIAKGQGTIADEVDAEGIGEFLPDLSNQDNTSETNTQSESLNYKTNSVKLDRKPIKNTINNSTGEQNENDSQDISDVLGSFDEEGTLSGYANGGGEHSGDRPPANSFIEDEEGNANLTISRNIKIKNIRIMVINQLEKKYKMILTLEESVSKGYVIINLSGEQGTDKANVNKAVLIDTVNKNLKTRSNKIYFDNIMKSKKLIIEFNLEYTECCSLEAKVYEY